MGRGLHQGRRLAGLPAAARRPAGLLVVALLLWACDGGDDTTPADEPPEPGDEVAEPEDAPDDPEPSDTGPVDPSAGVTDEPCPDAVDEELGCIHLGALVGDDEELSAAAAADALDGARDFWRRVNERGGVGGYEIAIDDHVREVGADAEAQARGYEDVAADVLALALLPGAATSDEILDAMDAGDLVGVMPSWWSGWQDPAVERGVVLASGGSHCQTTTLALEWYAGEFGQPISVLAVGHVGRYGGDVAAGARRWAEATEVEWLGFEPVEASDDPGVIGLEARAAVQAVLEEAPDLVVLGVGPAATGELARQAAAQGFEGSFLGAAPSWDPGLLDDGEQGQVLTALYRHAGPWRPLDGGAIGHEAMLSARDGVDAPASVGYLAGWAASYPLQAALERATEDGAPTRADVRAGVEDAEVTYEGALPHRTLGETPGAASVSATIALPDPEGLLGLRTRAEVSGEGMPEELVGQPCSSPGPR